MTSLNENYNVMMDQIRTNDYIRLIKKVGTLLNHLNPNIKVDTVIIFDLD